LLEGTATDLSPEVRMPARGALELYCHRVAGTVGQLCLPIFGADRTRSAGYAEALGRALQFTNILRDTASDLARGRLYYPLDELRAAGLDADTFAAAHEARRAYLAKFAARAAVLFEEAARTAPPPDRRALRPAFLMAAVYRALLRKMEKDGWRVMEKRCRLNTVEKVAALLRGLAQAQ
ncbi:MAG: squalene/phytoene synthase family protein, partial [Chthoniobacterales bacterium]